MYLSKHISTIKCFIKMYLLWYINIGYVLVYIKEQIIVIDKL